MKSLAIVFFTIISCGLGIIGCSGSPIDPWNNNNIINNNQNQIGNNNNQTNVAEFKFEFKAPEGAKVRLIGKIIDKIFSPGSYILKSNFDKAVREYYTYRPVPGLVPSGRLSCFDDTQYEKEQTFTNDKVNKLELEVDPHANSVDANFLGKYYAEFFNGQPIYSPDIPRIYCTNGKLYLSLICGFGWEVVGHNNKLVSRYDTDNDWVATATYEYNSEFERWEIFVTRQTKQIDPNTKKPLKEDSYSCRSYIVH